MFPYRRRLYGMNKRGLLHINAAAPFANRIRILQAGDVLIGKGFSTDPA
jgi:hypothetical protein